VSLDPSTVPFAAFDIEANDWDRFRCAALVTSEGDEEIFRSKDALGEGIAKLKRRVYGHYAGRYDFFFLPPLTNLCLSGSGILRANHGAAQLYDSWFLLQMSLAKIGKAVGMKKFEGKSDNINALSDAEVEEHCLNDTKILVKALHMHRAWCAQFEHPAPRWPATSGSTAMYVMEALEGLVVEHLRRELVDLDVWLDHWSAATGGRVEVLRLGEVAGPVYSYDINSSYPQSWCDGPLPVGPWRAVTVESRRAPGVYLCDVKQARSTLPVVAPLHRWQYDGEAWCTSEELAELRAQGGVAKVRRGYVSEETAPFGQKFVAAMYEAKLRGDPWAKVCINSAHGKLGQGVLQATHFRTLDGRWVVDRELVLPNWYQRPLISAFVLSRARLRLFRAMHALREDGWRVFYCDTDCVHTDCPPERFPLPVSDTALGAWKLEATATRSVYVAPKVYALDCPGEVKLRAKGMPKGVTIQHLLSAANGEAVNMKATQGLVGFLSQKEWGAKAATLKRTLKVQTGGKKHHEEGKAGSLIYLDARAVITPAAPRRR
jgi:hypothetical protein